MANDNSDPAKLGKIIRAIHHLTGTGSAEEQAARLKLLRDDVNATTMGAKEKLEDFIKRYLLAVRQLEDAGAPPKSDLEKAMDFVGALDGLRWG